MVTRYSYDRRVSLEVGCSTFTPNNLKLHHYRGSLVITDMTNAGKRGKKVREMTVIPKTYNDEAAAEVIKDVIARILHLTYDEAKRLLELNKDLQNFKLHEQELQAIKVEPMGTTVELENKFPNGNIVRITSSPHEFHVVDSHQFDNPGSPSHGMRQDTSYWSVGRKDGITFYAWIKGNMSAASKMTAQALIDVWNRLGVNYNAH